MRQHKIDHPSAQSIGVLSGFGFQKRNYIIEIPNYIAIKI